MSEFPLQNQDNLRVGVAAELARQYGEDAADFFQSPAIFREEILPIKIALIEKRGAL